ncbi:hypothetical protein PoB_007169100 [Plakobranchus ocellatus]|uniref:Uncharacterized protein n=1 Tax=Plakobranchus ocellatus TaxID=259542 RepID=A0AAV4DM02_9GAST|nr:hypothetical protein PoB_007169100 [Plakobranchus ocellatus]
MRFVCLVKRKKISGEVKPAVARQTPECIWRPLQRLQSVSGGRHVTLESFWGRVVLARYTGSNGEFQGFQIPSPAKLMYLLDVDYYFLL